MDSSNSANVSISDPEDHRTKSKSARCIQHSLSSAMAEALYQPHTLTQPKPLASRVKDAGKDFLRQNQTCQWIQFNSGYPETVEDKREARQTKIVSEREVVHVLKDTDRREVPEIELPPIMESTSPSYEEQLLALHSQQEVLLAQQHRIEGQMESQKQARQQQSLQELQSKMIPVEIPHLEEPPTVAPTRTCIDITNSVNCPPTRFRRRLKGSIAKSFAERDEGSIGSLLYNTRAQEAPTEKRSCLSNSSYGIYSRHDQEGGQYAQSQESGSDISQILSHLPCCSSFDIVKNSSESSATDTVMTDLTMKGRKIESRNYER